MQIFDEDVERAHGKRLSKITANVESVFFVITLFGRFYDILWKGRTSLM
jgi:hypothetical protein